jgi:hypothetical protein
MHDGTANEMADLWTPSVKIEEGVVPPNVKTGKIHL